MTVPNVDGDQRYLLTNKIFKNNARSLAYSKSSYLFHVKDCYLLLFSINIKWIQNDVIILLHLNQKLFLLEICLSFKNLFTILIYFFMMQLSNKWWKIMVLCSLRTVEYYLWKFYYYFVARIIEHLSFAHKLISTYFHLVIQNIFSKIYLSN